MAIYRKGVWSPDEDEKLKSYILRYGHGCWSSFPAKAGLQRNGKSCRLRWINYLRPGLKRGVFTDKEDETILTLQRSLGNKWSQMAQKLPGRTDNEIKNYWHSYLKKQRSTKTSDSTASAGSEETTNEVSSLNAVPKVFSQDNSIPKVLFAEWFSPDHHEPSHNYLHSMNTTVPLGDTPDDSLGGYSNEYADAMHHELNTTTTVSEFQQVENGSTSEIYDDFMIYDDLNYM